jgi:diguanylate cyclase (GGDEF)-like protein
MLTVSALALVAVAFAVLYGRRQRLRAIAQARSFNAYLERIGDMLDCSKRFALAARTSAVDVCSEIDSALHERFADVDCLALFVPWAGKLACIYATPGSRCERYAGRADYDVTVESDVLPVAALKAGIVVTSKSGPRPIHPADTYAVAIPLTLDRGNTSVLYLSSGARPFDDVLPAVQMLVEQAEPALLLAQEREEIESRATYDGLTGLLGRAAFDAVLHAEVDRCERTGSTLAVLYIDTDGFKAWNDEFGHHAGDGVLQRIGEILSSARRSPRDLVGRRGGDEFCVALIDTDKTEAIEFARNIGAAIAFDDRAEYVPAEMGDTAPLPLTASIGVAVFPRDADGYDALLHRADAIMYEAKRLGKDRICYIGDDRAIHEVRVSESDRRDPGTRPFIDRRMAHRPFAIVPEAS